MRDKELMSSFEAYDPRRLTGFRLEQLAAAFDRVRNPRDWKAPIRAVIAAGERSVVEQAVLWFTETVAVFEPARGEAERLMVTAPGYRLGPAGNPPGDAPLSVPATPATDGRRRSLEPVGVSP